MPKNDIYQFLKNNNLTTKSEEDFLAEYSDEAKAQELYNFFSDNDLTEKDYNSFYDQYLKKKDEKEDLEVFGEDLSLLDEESKSTLMSTLEGKGPGEPKLIDVDFQATQKPERREVAIGEIAPTETKLEETMREQVTERMPEILAAAKELKEGRLEENKARIEELMPSVDENIQNIWNEGKQVAKEYTKLIGKPPTPEVKAESKRLIEEIRDIDKRFRYAHDTKDMLKKSQKYIETADAGVFESMFKGTLWKDFYTLGAQELSRDVNVLAVAKKKEKGIPTTEEEDLAIHAYGLSQMVGEDVDPGVASMVGSGVVETIPYLAQLALTGPGAASAKTAAKTGVSSLLKGMSKKNLGKLAANATGAVAGAAVRVPAMTDFYSKAVKEQIGAVTPKVEEGKFTATFDPGTQKEAIGAFGKSFASTFGTVLIESSGGYANTLLKNSSKRAAGSRLINNASKSTVDKLKDAVSFNGFWGEFGEEIVDGYYQSALKGEFDPTKVFTPKELLATGITVGVFSGMFSAVNTMVKNDPNERAIVVQELGEAESELAPEIVSEVDRLLQGEDIKKNVDQLDSYIKQKIADGATPEEVGKIIDYAVLKNGMESMIESEQVIEQGEEVIEAEKGPVTPEVKEEVKVEEKVPEKAPEAQKEEIKPKEEVDEEVVQPQEPKEAIQEEIEVEEKEVLTKKEEDAIKKEDVGEDLRKREEERRESEEVRKGEEVTKKELPEEEVPAKKVKAEDLSISDKKPTPKGLKRVLKAGDNAVTMDINEKGDKVGEVTLEENKETWDIKRVDVDKEHQRRGIAKNTYINLNEDAKKEGKVLRSDRADKINEESRPIWESLVKTGEAIKLEDGSYIFKTEKDADKIKEESPKAVPEERIIEEEVSKVRVRDDEKIRLEAKESKKEIGDIFKKTPEKLIEEAQSLEEIQSLLSAGRIKFTSEYNKKKAALVAEGKLDDETGRVKAIEAQIKVGAKEDFSKEISKKVDEDVKTRKEELTEKQEEVKERLKGRLEKLSGAKFALKEGEKNTDVIKELVGVVGDLAELGVIQLEKGVDHVTTKLKDYLSNIDPENIDKYKDDIAQAYNLKEEVEVKEDEVVFKTQAEADKSTDEKAKAAMERTPLSLSEPTLWDTFLTKFQNKYRRVDKLISEAKKRNVISDEIDASLQLELMSGKATKKIEDKEESVLEGKPKGKKSIADRARKDGVTLDELGTYMLAKHAPERNAFKMKEFNAEMDGKIAEVNKRLEQAEDKKAIARLNDKIERLEAQKIKQEEVDILNKKAEAYINKIEGGKKADKFKQYSDEVRKELIDARQEALIEYGLVDQELIDKLKETYPNYVPYFVLSRQVGKGIPGQRSTDVKGPDIRRARSLVDIEDADRTNPITQALLEYSNTVIRGEKNLVNQSLLNFSEKVDNDIMEVIKPKYMSKMNEQGFIETIPTGLEGIPENERLHLKVDGKPVVLHIKDKALMRAMTGSGTARSISGLNKINNYLRFVNTLYNPEFIVTNLTRDLQTAAINITAEDKKGLKRKFAKNIPKAMKGIWQNEQGNLNTEWSQVVEELRDLGGEVSWLNTENIEQLEEKLRKQFNKYNHDKTDAKLKHALGTAAHYIESLNKTIEMTSRVAAYKAAVDSGVSKPQAARLAKNLTVNFNKKGELGALMDSLYLFANAGIQGSTVLLKNVATSKKVQAITAGIVVGSFLLNYMNNAINEEEYEKIPEGVKERNLIIMHPSGNHNKIPLPYGYNIFKVLGDKIYESSTGKKRVGEASVEMFKSFMNAFNPVSSSTLSQSVSPTVLDPFVQVSENKNWFDGDIKPPQPPYGSRVPESELFFESAKPMSVKIARWINRVTGGTMATKGKVDISPEYIDHFTDFLGGGLGRFVMNSINTGSSVLKGEGVEPNNIPFMRQFYGKPSEKADLGIIYNTLQDSWNKEFNENEIDKFNKALSRARRNGLITIDEQIEYKENFSTGQRAVRYSKNNPDLSRDEVKKRVK